MQGAGFNMVIEIEMMIAPMLLVGEHVLELRVSDAMLHDAKEMHATLASRRDNTVQLLVSARLHKNCIPHFKYCNSTQIITRQKQNSRFNTRCHGEN